jgi:myosin heavy subunit
MPEQNPYADLFKHLTPQQKALIRTKVEDMQGGAIKQMEAEATATVQSPEYNVPGKSWIDILKERRLDKKIKALEKQAVSDDKARIETAKRTKKHVQMLKKREMDKKIKQMEADAKKQAAETPVERTEAEVQMRKEIEILRDKKIEKLEEEAKKQAHDPATQLTEAEVEMKKNIARDKKIKEMEAEAKKQVTETPTERTDAEVQALKDIQKEKQRKQNDLYNRVLSGNATLAELNEALNQGLIERTQHTELAKTALKRIEEGRVQTPKEKTKKVDAQLEKLVDINKQIAEVETKIEATVSGSEEWDALNKQLALLKVRRDNARSSMSDEMQDALYDAFQQSAGDLQKTRQVLQVAGWSEDAINEMIAYEREKASGFIGPPQPRVVP